MVAPAASVSRTFERFSFSGPLGHGLARRGTMMWSAVGSESAACSCAVQSIAPSGQLTTTGLLPCGCLGLLVAAAASLVFRAALCKVALVRCVGSSRRNSMAALGRSGRSIRSPTSISCDPVILCGGERLSQSDTSYVESE